MSDATIAAPRARLQTGITGLDTILLGGFIRNGLYIIHGAPGAGKTILGNQICFRHAADGGHALYVTLLSEQHERLIANLAQMSFFDQSRIAHDIIYFSAFQLLERDGLAGLLTLLRREIVARSANLLVLDGLVAAEAYATTELEQKKFIHELQMLAAAADCTMFLLTSTGDADAGLGQRPEHTMVDGMIALRDTAYGWRVERDIQVRKFRGSDHLPGRHALQITDDGITVWPRTEALRLPRTLRRREPSPPRLSTGVAGLDAMLQGGLSEGSSTVVLGPTGAGKTGLGLQFLAASSRDEPGLLLSFYETPEQLLHRIAGFAPHVVDHVRDGVVSFQWQGTAEDMIDRTAQLLLGEVRRRGVRRVVIDGLLGFEDMALQPDRTPQFYRALTGQLRELGATTVCTTEVPELVGPISRPPLSRMTPVAENLILLRHVEIGGSLKRVLSLMKVRDSGFDTRLREFEIGRGGFVLVDDALAARTDHPDGPTDNRHPAPHAADSDAGTGGDRAPGA
jgi:circadian clock protein KaiC